MKNFICVALSPALFLFILLICTPVTHAQDSLNINLLEAYHSFDHFHDVELFNNYLLIATGSSGLLIVDEYLTQDPVIINQIDEPLISVDQVVVNGNEVVLIGNHLQRYDLSDPFNPELISRDEWDYYSYTGFYYGIYDNKLLFNTVMNFRLLTWHDNGTYTTQQMNFPVNYMSYSNRSELQRHLLFDACQNYDTDRHDLEIWDISDLDNPEMISLPEEIKEMEIFDFALSENRAVVTNGTTLMLIGLENINRIRVLGSWKFEHRGYTHFGRPILTESNVFIPSNNEFGECLIVLTITEDDKLELATRVFIEDTYNSRRLSIDDHLIWAARSNGLTVVDVSSPDTPVLINNWDDVLVTNEVTRVEDHFIFSGNETDPRVLVHDFSDGESFLMTHTFYHPDYDRIVVKTTNNNLCVLNCRSKIQTQNLDPEIQFLQLASIDNGIMHLRGIVDTVLNVISNGIIHENALYAIRNLTGEFAIYDISNPDNPTYHSAVQFNVQPDYYRMLSYENYLLLWNSSGGFNPSVLVSVYDISDPLNPEFSNSFSLHGAYSAVIVDDVIIGYSNQQASISSLQDIENVQIDRIIDFNEIPNVSYSREVLDFQDGFLLMSTFYSSNIYNSKLQVLNTIDPEEDQIIASYSLPNHVKARFAENKIIATWENGYGLFEWISTDVEEVDNNQLPEEKVLDIYPNPANPFTTLSLYLHEKGEVNISLFDLLGREIQQIASGNLNRGQYYFQINQDNHLASGTYFLNVKMNDYQVNKKIVILK